ncbi:hypothetical protein [Actinomadura spongiicola]|nr:hypothetical protein [Actinomadura spongiicola]
MNERSGAVDPQLDAHLRNTLTKVAMTVDTLPIRPERASRRRRRVVLAAGLTALAVPTLGFAYLHSGPGTVARLPTEHAILHGESGGDEYWLVPTFHRDVCGNPMPGVELVSKRRNPIGAEWDTAGVGFEGSPTKDGCHGKQIGPTSPDEADWLATRLGRRDDRTSDWVVVGAFHPRVRSVRITTSAGGPRIASTVPRPDDLNGPRYSAITAPGGATWAKLTLLDERGNPIPGGVRNFDLRGWQKN